MNQCLCKANALQHALGIGAQSPFARSGQANEFDQFVYLFLQASAAQSTKTPKETKRFFSAEIFIEVRIFRQKTDGFPAFHETTVTPENFRAAVRWRNQPENYFEGCAFAGTIRSEQPKYFPRFNPKVEVLHGDNPASGMQGNGKYFR
jgi:hypothetical protein